MDWLIAVLGFLFGALTMVGVHGCEVRHWRTRAKAAEANTKAVERLIQSYSDELKATERERDYIAGQLMHLRFKSGVDKDNNADRHTRKILENAKETCAKIYAAAEATEESK